MDAINELITSLPNVPPEHLIALVALGALALAAWAIHVVASIASERKSK